MSAPNTGGSGAGDLVPSAASRPSVDIALINDHRLSRQGMRLLLERLDDHLRVSGEASNDAEAVELLRSNPPDVALIDLTSREDGSLAAAISRIKSLAPGVNVIVITPIDSPSEVVRVIRAGANGYLTHNSSPADVLKAIHVVSEGGSWIDPLLTPVVMEEYRKLTWPEPGTSSESTALNRRDREFLELLAAGKNNRQISESTGLAESTVKNNLSTLFRKLGVRDRTQAVLFAIENGIVARGASHRD